MKRFILISLQVLISAAVLGAGVFGAVQIFKSKPKPERQERAVVGHLVDVTNAQTVTRAVTVAGRGRVVAARSVALKAELSGRVVTMHPSLVAGGRVAAGDLLVELDKRDYQDRANQTWAQVTRTILDVEVEKGRKNIAEREWKQLGIAEHTTEAGRALALRDPHAAASAANLGAARSSHAQSVLNLSRTKLEAPFDAIVMTESVEVGAYVGPSAPLAELVDSSEFHVYASIPLSRLSWVRVPGLNTDAQRGSRVQVVTELSEGRQSRRVGHVVRLLADLEPVGRMARIVVAVPDPLTADDAGMPLLLGSSVRVEIDGRVLDGVAAIPRDALRAGGQVWTVSAAGTLWLRDVEVAWKDRETALIGTGLVDGEAVVVSALASPVAGMPLRVSRQVPFTLPAQLALPEVAPPEVAPPAPEGLPSEVAPSPAPTSAGLPSPVSAAESSPL